MPAPRTTDKYPIWLKQALEAMVEVEGLVPYRITFPNASALKRFQTQFYGYQSALKREEEAARRQDPTHESRYHLYGNLMLRKARAEESPESELDYRIDWRDDDPAMREVKDQFLDAIALHLEQSFSSPSAPPINSEPFTPTSQGSAMDDFLGDYLEDSKQEK